jgi:hypothetical protein
MALPEDIKVFPAFLQGMVDRVNALLKAVRPLDALEVTAPLTLSKTDKVARLGVSRPALQDALRGALIEAGPTNFPFKLQDVSASGELRVSLYTTTSTGFVNGIRPTIGGTAINVPNTYLVLTTTKEIVLRATRDFSVSPSTFACTVEVYDVGSVPAEDVNADDWTSYLVLGRATITSGVMTLTNNDEWPDMSVENYGASNLWYAAPRI